MKYSNQSYNLRIELDAKDCELSPDEISHMERALDSLHQITKSFPLSDMYITVIHHPRSGDYHVKTALVLSGNTLFTGERHRDRLTAYLQCIDKLVHKVSAYKSRMSGEPLRSKTAQGTEREIVPSQVPDHDAIQHALKDRDYASFRHAMLPYEEQLRKRIGRWIQRYPALNEQIGDRLLISDLVEDVFLTAFDQAEHRPREMHPGKWLEGLMDEAIHSLIEHPDDELENISMVRSALEAAQEQP